MVFLVTRIIFLLLLESHVSVSVPKFDNGVNTEKKTHSTHVVDLRHTHWTAAVFLRYTHGNYQLHHSASCTCASNINVMEQHFSNSTLTSTLLFLRSNPCLRRQILRLLYLKNKTKKNLIKKAFIMKNPFLSVFFLCPPLICWWNFIVGSLFCYFYFILCNLIYFYGSSSLPIY